MNKTKISSKDSINRVKTKYNKKNIRFNDEINDLMKLKANKFKLDDQDIEDKKLFNEFIKFKKFLEIKKEVKRKEVIKNIFKKKSKFVGNENSIKGIKNDDNNKIQIKMKKMIVMKKMNQHHH